MEIRKLAPQTAQFLGANVEVIIDHEDLTAAAVTQTVQIFPVAGSLVPAGTKANAMGYHLDPPFDGGATSDLTLQIGDGDDPNRYLTAHSIHEDGTEVDYGPVGLPVTQPHVYSAADGIDALFTATGANVSVLTAGKLRIYLKVDDISKLDLVN
jgi:hypothetical protein